MDRRQTGQDGQDGRDGPKQTRRDRTGQTYLSAAKTAENEQYVNESGFWVWVWVWVCVCDWVCDWDWVWDWAWVRANRRERGEPMGGKPRMANERLRKRTRSLGLLWVRWAGISPTANCAQRTCAFAWISCVNGMPAPNSSFFSSFFFLPAACSAFALSRVCFMRLQPQPNWGGEIRLGGHKMELFANTQAERIGHKASTMPCGEYLGQGRYRHRKDWGSRW